MSRLCTPQPAVTVASMVGLAGDVYDCPDIEAIDGHIFKLSERYKKSRGRFPGLQKIFEYDTNLLLDLRIVLAKLQSGSDSTSS